MKVTDGAITLLLIILSVSAYENVFLEQQFVYVKVRVMFDLEFMDIFFKTNTKKCINSNNI